MTYLLRNSESCRVFNIFSNSFPTFSLLQRKVMSFFAALFSAFFVVVMMQFKRKSGKNPSTKQLVRLFLQNEFVVAT